MADRSIALCAASMLVLLSACASANREQASVIADSGIAATSALSTHISDTAMRVSRGQALSAFRETWLTCQNANVSCQPRIPSDNVRTERQRLVEAVALRTRAVDALNQAYHALKLEADYDARGDLEGAVGEAATSASSYASALGVGAQFEIAQHVAVFGSGLFAESRQRERLLAANSALADVVAQLRIALTAEQAVFDSLATAVTDEEVEGHRVLLQAGFVSHDDLILPLITAVGAEPTGDISLIFEDSAGARAGAEAVLITSATERTNQVKARYAASLEALRALERVHRDFVAERAVSATDVQRLIDRLSALQSDSQGE